MDEPLEKVSQSTEKTRVLESPKPVAFTVDFGDNRPLDTAKYKNLVEKYQNRHRRGQSLSKIEEPVKPPVKKYPLTGNLPRKSGYHAEGYHSSDEKGEKQKSSGVRSSVLNSVIKKGELTLPLKPLSNDRMTQSFPSRSFELPIIDSPEVEIKDISSPELDPMSPLSPLLYMSDVKLNRNSSQNFTENSDDVNSNNSSEDMEIEKYKSCATLQDKSDEVSEAGTYTIDVDNYTEEQKLRMSIDKDFNIEQVSVLTKAREYVQNLLIGSPIEEHKQQNDFTPEVQPVNLVSSNSSLNNTNKTTKVLNSSPRSKQESPDSDRGVFTLITTSGVLNKQQQRKSHGSSHNLVKSVVALETYPSTLTSSVDMQITQTTNGIQRVKESPTTVRSITQTLFAQNISAIDTEYLDINGGRLTNLPPSIGGSPRKNSPLHTARNRNSYSSANCDFSDSSLETESYLKPTQNIITSLQQRLSIDSDSDTDQKYHLPLNNEAKILLKSKPVHVRHNSFDDRSTKLTNKLEHFHNKNLQGIDQTLIKSCNQYSQNRVHQIQNSPNNSPIRRSSSFSLKNQFDNQQKCLNTQVIKDNNYRKLTNPPSNISIQRSSSTANIKPKQEIVRRASINSDTHSDRNNYLESDTTSEEEFEKTIVKNKKDLTTTHYNRAFSLRRARLDAPKCPNTPEMRRKFAPTERPASVDRKSAKSIEIQSRYMNISKAPKSAPPKADLPKNLPKGAPKPQPAKQAFSRTDSGRFSLRSPKPLSANQAKPLSSKKDGKFLEFISKVMRTLNKSEKISLTT